MSDELFELLKLLLKIPDLHSEVNPIATGCMFRRLEELIAEEEARRKRLEEGFLMSCGVFPEVSND